MSQGDIKDVFDPATERLMFGLQPIEWTIDIKSGRFKPSMEIDEYISHLYHVERLFKVQWLAKSLKPDGNKTINILLNDLTMQREEMENWASGFKVHAWDRSKYPELPEFVPRDHQDYERVETVEIVATPDDLVEFLKAKKNHLDALITYISRLIGYDSNNSQITNHQEIGQGKKSYHPITPTIAEKLYHLMIENRIIHNIEYIDFYTCFDLNNHCQKEKRIKAVYNETKVLIYALNKIPEIKPAHAKANFGITNYGSRQRLIPGNKKVAVMNKINAILKTDV